MINYNFLTKTPREIDQLIASRIRSIRKRRKISQKRLSEKSGVSLGSVKRFEQNANSHFLRPAGPHFPASQGHIKRSALEIGRARGAPPC